MHIIDGVLVLGKQDCPNCAHQPTPGTYPGHRTCPGCDGTGNGPRGGRGKCRKGFVHTFPLGTVLTDGYVIDRPCYRGSKYGERCTVPDFENRIPCPSCNGDYRMADDEGITDQLPQAARELVAALPVVYAKPENREGNFLESYIGVGLYSCTDYGRWRDKPLEDLEDHVRDSIRKEWLQACKVVRKSDHRLATHIGIALRRDGYSVYGVIEGRPIA